MDNSETIEFSSIDEQFFQTSIRMKKFYQLLLSIHLMGLKVYETKRRCPGKTSIKHRMASFFKRLFK